VRHWSKGVDTLTRPKMSTEHIVSTAPILAAVNSKCCFCSKYPVLFS